MKTYKIPPVFYLDHIARDCGKSGKIVRSAKQYLIVELDDIALDDLYSDASYYSECSDQFDFDNQGLCKSATATVRALNNQLNKGE